MHIYDHARRFMARSDWNLTISAKLQIVLDHIKSFLFPFHFVFTVVPYYDVIQELCSNIAPLQTKKLSGESALGDNSEETRKVKGVIHHHDMVVQARRSG